MLPVESLSEVAGSNLATLQQASKHLVARSSVLQRSGVMTVCRMHTAE